MPTANGVIAEQTADSHDAEKNIFSDESRGDDQRHAGDDERRAGDDERRAGEDDQRRGNNDPRHNKQPRQNNQPRRDKRDVHGWVVLDKPIGMTSTHAVAVLSACSRPSAPATPARSILWHPAACRSRSARPPRRFPS
jgi:tRNA pseudouridine55 synthase